MPALKPRDYYVYEQLGLASIVCILPMECVCVLRWFLELTTMFSLHSTHRLVFPMNVDFFCQVRTECLYVMYITFNLQMACLFHSFPIYASVNKVGFSCGSLYFKFAVVVVVIVVVAAVVVLVIIVTISTAGLTTVFIDSLDCHIYHTSDLQPTLILYRHTATGSIPVMRYFRSSNYCPDNRYYTCIGRYYYYILFMPLRNRKTLHNTHSENW